MRFQQYFGPIVMPGWTLCHTVDRFVETLFWNSMHKTSISYLLWTCWLLFCCVTKGIPHFPARFAIRNKGESGSVNPITKSWNYFYSFSFSFSWIMSYFFVLKDTMNIECKWKWRCIKRMLLQREFRPIVPI